MIFYCQLVVRDVLFSVKSPITFYSIVCCGYFSFTVKGLNPGVTVDRVTITVSHCHRQQSFSGLPSPGRSHYTINYFGFVIFFIPELLTNLRQSKVDLGCISLGKSEIGFLVQDHMDSLQPKKRKISFWIIFVTSHEIMLIYETMNGATKLC